MLDVIIVLVVILFSMVLHELAHGFVAYKLGDDTAKEDGRLTLNPLKHIDPVMSIAMPLLLLLSGGPVFGGAKPVPVNTSRLKHGVWGMALVAIAGPLTNLILAFLSFLIGYWVGTLGVYEGELYHSTGILGSLSGYFVMINLGFAIFNMIPIPPLDGSRLLYAIAPDPVREIMTNIERMGIMVVMVIVVLGSGFISSLMSGAIGGILHLFMWIVGAA